MRNDLLRRISLVPLMAVAVFAPLVVGSFPVFPAVFVFAALCAFCLFAFGSPAASGRSKKIALAILSTCLAVALCDLVARPAVAWMIGERPRELSVHTWEPMPLVYRYDSNVRYRGKIYGDLAAMSLDKTLRRYRDFEFTTDAYGFRNDPATATARAPDLILLGDSFGAGTGTSQDATWASLLARESGLAVYNLSIEGAGPWQEFVNLELEVGRVKPREGALVLWAIFAGNDLDDPYYPALNPAELPWQSRLQQLAFNFKKFRYRSPVRRVVTRASGGAWAARENVVIRDLSDGRKILFYAPFARAAARTHAEVLSQPNFELLTATFAAMKHLADERRLRVAVALVPGKEEVYRWALEGAPAPAGDADSPSGFSRALADLSAQQGFAFLDLKPRMTDEARRAYLESGALLWWEDDIHWNDLGHRVAARIVQDELLRALAASEKVSGAGGK
jgi:hypothetical protein